MLEVLLQIAKFCDVYLMERVLDDESGVSVPESEVTSLYLICHVFIIFSVFGWGPHIYDAGCNFLNSELCLELTLYPLL